MMIIEIVTLILNMKIKVKIIVAKQSKKVVSPITKPSVIKSTSLIIRLCKSPWLELSIYFKGKDRNNIIRAASEFMSNFTKACKMELDGYSYIESPYIATYNHMNRNGLCTMLALNKAVEDETVGKNIAMQIASAAPVAIDESGVPQSVKDNEVAVAIEKTKAEQVQKAVEAAIKKAGYNPAHFDSEDHMESNQAKGWITAEDVAAVKKIIAEVSAEKAANLNEAMIQNIAKGRLNKFLKENCLMSQEYIWDKNFTVESYLHSVDKELTVTDFKRFTLRAE